MLQLIANKAFTLLWLDMHFLLKV